MSLAEFESWMAYLDHATGGPAWTPGAKHSPHDGSTTDANLLWRDYAADPSGFESLTVEQKAFLVEEAKWRLGRLGALARGVIGEVAWDPTLHPRDSHGRFVEVGDMVTLPGGRSGTVTAVLPDGNLTVMDESRSRVVVESVPAVDVTKPVRRGITPSLVDTLVAADMPVADLMPPKDAAATVARWRKVKAKRGVPVDDDYIVPGTGFEPGDVLMFGHPGRWKNVTVLDTHPDRGTVTISIPYTAGGTSWTREVPNRLGMTGGNVLTWPRAKSGANKGLRMVPKHLANRAITPADLQPLLTTKVGLTPEEARSFAQSIVDRATDLASRPDLDDHQRITLALLSAVLKDKRLADWLDDPDSVIAAYRPMPRRDAHRLRRRWARGDVAVLPDGRTVTVIGPGSRPGRTRVRSGAAPFEVDSVTLGFPPVPGSGPEAGHVQVPDHMIAAYAPIGSAVSRNGLTQNEQNAAHLAMQAVGYLVQGKFYALDELDDAIADVNDTQRFGDGRDHADDLYDGLRTMRDRWREHYVATGKKPDNGALGSAMALAVILERMADGHDRKGDDPDLDALVTATIRAARVHQRDDPYWEGVWNLGENVTQLWDEWAPAREPTPNPYRDALYNRTVDTDPHQGTLFEVEATQPVWLPDRWQSVTDSTWAQRLAQDLYDDDVLSRLAPADRKEMIDTYIADLPPRRQAFTLDGGSTVVMFADIAVDLPPERKVALLETVTKAHDATGVPVTVAVDPAAFVGQNEGALAFTIRGTPLIHIRPETVAFAANRDEDGNRTDESIAMSGGSMNNLWNLNVDPLEWTVAHELGHVIDTHGPAAYEDRIGFTSILDMSAYGQTQPAEAYAEAFAAWLVTGGEFTTPTVDSLAKFGRWRSKYRKVKGKPWSTRGSAGQEWVDRVNGVAEARRAAAASSERPDLYDGPVAALRTGVDVIAPRATGRNAPTVDTVPTSAGAARTVAEYATHGPAARDAERRQATATPGVHYGVVGRNGRYYVVAEGDPVEYGSSPRPYEGYDIYYSTDLGAYVITLDGVVYGTTASAADARRWVDRQDDVIARRARGV